MKILDQQQIRNLDQKTIQSQGLSGIELMERAVAALMLRIDDEYIFTDKIVHVFAGSGNNGGDGIGIAAHLAEQGIEVRLYYCNYSAVSSENLAMRNTLPQYKYLQSSEIADIHSFPDINKKDIVIDAIMGNGINRTVGGIWQSLIEHINKSQAYIISVDIPSGLHPDRYLGGLSIHADRTLAIGCPRKSFFFLENQEVLGDWSIVDIGWDKESLDSIECNDTYLLPSFLKSIQISPRKKFAHKGNFGHALLINGSYGKMGAAILAARSCLRSGVGLLTCHVPRIGYPIMQTSVPEAMVSIDQHEFYFHSCIDTSPYSAIGVGSGIDHRSGVKEALSYLLKNCKKPMVLDADALNIIAGEKNWLSILPPQSILTPHPGEFRRLFGDWQNDEEKLQKQLDLSVKYQLYIVLKGAHTSISSPEGELFFNSTGNPGMATAGSGDTLTGILTAMLARGLTPLHACLLGVYVHGLAGDLAKQDWGETSLISSDIIEHLGKAYQIIERDTQE
ncbi:NAD(P)H-hydrate dehydratase [Membranihabitans marinus]|uniref:NAD(P)H-hydrate dehydratase n=1 Tax=Membranihabitans marinus TaxID=1227546 RepID=UPI001F023D0E|nr:NAD(P)H-hydrate dehydratase [Membranihabitans marinus]